MKSFEYTFRAVAVMILILALGVFAFLIALGNQSLQASDQASAFQEGWHHIHDIKVELLHIQQDGVPADPARLNRKLELLDDLSRRFPELEIEVTPIEDLEMLAEQPEMLQAEILRFQQMEEAFQAQHWRTREDNETSEHVVRMSRATTSGGMVPGIPAGSPGSRYRWRAASPP